MESLAIIIGALGISFLLFYFSQHLDTENFWLSILKLFVVLFALFFLIVVPKAMLNADCQLLLNKTEKSEFYLYGNDFNETGIHWDSDDVNDAPNTQSQVYLYHMLTNETNTYSTYCKEQDNTATTAFNAYLWFVGVIGIFMLVYYSVTVFDYFKRRKNGE